MEHAEVEEPIHTEHIQDIIGTPPRWLYQWGITFVLAIATICTYISSLIDYPEEVHTQIKLLSTYLPYSVSIKDSGKLAAIFIQNDCMVRKGDSLALIKNAEGKTIVKAPISGRLMYAGIIHENEQFAPTQHIFLISSGDMNFYGEMIIPPNYAYKVKPKQTVLVQFKNTSDEKKSMVIGSIKYITNEQFKNDQYIAEVDFDNTKEIGPFLRNGMIADAEIITSRETLFHRLIQSLTKGIK